MMDNFEPIRGQRVLVTGGLGFCGWNLVSFLSQELECAVTVVDDCSNASPPSLLPLHVEVIEADVRDEKQLAPHVRSQPWVFHLALLKILYCFSYAV
jgi:nucleoside-diphosphate-sugar epimerase